MPLKKVYCRSCRRLVRPQEAKGLGNIQLRCPRCSSMPYTWDGLRWQ